MPKSGFRVRPLRLFWAAAIVLSTALAAARCGAMDWVSPNRYRVVLTVDPRGAAGKNRPASADIDFPKMLSDAGGKGAFDENTIEVVGYDESGRPRVFNPCDKGYERYLLPWRIDRYFRTTAATLHFVMPDEKCTRYAVYFDVAESKLGKPTRYPGLVGDGDLFRQEYGRRELAPSHFDTFCDFDGDGDLDFFRGGVPPWVECFENVGANRYLDRGRLTNDGKLFSLPPDKQGRSWVTVTFDDWDGDGDMDFFPSFAVGYSSADTAGHTWMYENVTERTTVDSPASESAVPPLRFADRGRLLTVSGKPLGMSGSFAGVAFADLDADGRKDLILQRDSVFEFHKDTRTASFPAGPTNQGHEAGSTKAPLTSWDEGVLLRANGTEMQASTAQFDLADIDSDGDLDLFSGSQHGCVHWFENVGGPKRPVFAAGRLLVFFEFLDAHSGVKVADFDGDGLLDLIVGRFWERTHWEDQPRFHGRLYKNVGTKTHPRFKPLDAYHGAPYTEGFQPCDAVRQNRVRAFDWNGDGRMDLIASDTDGRVWFFRNTTDNLRPVFAPGVRMTAAGRPIRRFPDTNFLGYAKTEIADWDNDGLPDLFVLDSTGLVALYLNQGTRTEPKLAPGVDLQAGGKPIQLPSFAGGIIVCDWNSDGRKDIVGSCDSGFYFYENVGTDASPVLAEGKRVRFGPSDDGKTEYWLRPSAGAFVDWDGDGKKDLIAGEFEYGVRLYKNIGPGTPGTEPEFADPNGVFIVRPPVGMTAFGADAKDFNGDGEIDIITGQGHGGSGLRFFARSYIEDIINNTTPVVTVGDCQVRR